jgi:ferredoxin
MLKNIFNTPLFGPVMRSPWTWRIARLLCLAVVLIMIAVGWHHHAIPGVKVPDPLMYTSLTTHLFWVWWIMGVVFIALLFGRGWCTVCPLGWTNGLANRFGFNRPLPRWLQNFIPVTLALLVLQLAVYFLELHRHPDLTARLLTLLLLLAVIAGLIFRGHAFCRLLCPAGAVFGLYARLAPWSLRVRNTETCEACSEKNCISGKPLWRKLALGPAVLFWHGRRKTCPVDLVPEQVNNTAACTLCLHCAHNCDNDNIAMGRRPWLEDLGRAPLTPSETLFFLVLLGLLTVNFTKVYPDLRQWVWAAPEQVALLLGWTGTGYYLLAALWAAVVFPLLLLLPAWGIWRLSDLRVTTLTGENSSPLPAPPSAPVPEIGFWARMGHLALPLIPLLLIVHLILAVVKINAKAGFLPYALRDPSGVKSYLAMNVMQTVPPPGLLLQLDLLKWLIMTLLLGGTALCLPAVRRCMRALPPRTSAPGFVAAVAVTVGMLGALYGATVIRWLFVR